MFPHSKTFQKHTLKLIGAAALLLLIGSIAVVRFASPVLGAADVQGDSQAVETRQEMMGAGAQMTSTMPMSTMPMMSMAEMGAMMDAKMAQMNSMMASMPMSGEMPMSGTMPMTGTMSMAEMGQMMQMMGMMHQMMGQMQMMMGTMMSGHMMGGGMMGEGMMGGAVVPDAADAAPPAAATAAPPATGAEDDHAEHSADHPAATLDATPQSATAGAITVKASPLVGEELLEIAFAITLETHSVELDFDLAERATLTIGGYSFPATEWVPDAPDGHHVAGTLYFTIDHPAHAALAEVDAVALDLEELDGQRVTLQFAVD